MKNSLLDLNDHLFAQLERLGDENMAPDQIEAEIKRAVAISGVADRVVHNASLVLKAHQVAHDVGHMSGKEGNMLGIGKVSE